MLIGFAAIHVTRAGVGIALPASVTKESLNMAPHATSELIVNIFPENIAKSVAEGQVLQVVVFSLFFGCALAMVPEAKRRPLVAFADSLSETMFKLTNLVMFLAAIGVFGAVAYTVGHLGLGILLPALKLLATMYGALVVFVLVVLLPIAILIGVPRRRFLRAVAEPVTIAFATASSEAALPRCDGTDGWKPWE
jgi:proton glutamate symport protein